MKTTVTCGCGVVKEISERCRDQSIARYGAYKCLSCIVKARGSKNGDGMRNKSRRILGMLNNDVVEAVCYKCGNVIKLTFSALKMWRKRHNTEDYVCNGCLNRIQDRGVSQSEEHRLACSERSKKNWGDPNFKKKVKEAVILTWQSSELKMAASESSKAAWQDNSYRERVINGNKVKWADGDYRRRMSQIRRSLWNDPNYREKMRNSKSGEKFHNKMSEIVKKIWENEAYRAAVSTANKERWKDPELKKIVSDAQREMWRDPVYRAHIRKKIFETWTDERRTKASEIGRNLWDDTEYRQKVMGLREGPEFKKRMHDALKQAWTDPDFRAAVIRTNKLTWMDVFLRDKARKNAEDQWSSQESREAASLRSKESWQNLSPEDKKKVSLRSKEAWQDDNYRNAIMKHWEDPVFREKMAKIREQQPRVSSLQEVFYSLLDDLNIKYFREHKDGPADQECRIGPWGFDCVIPRQGKPTLLVEMQGDYWHNFEERRVRDAAKASYIINNFAGRYEIKHLWEHEFKCQDKIVELIKYWMGLTQIELYDFNFDDVQIKDCPAADYRSLLSKYHYLPNAGRGGKALGAYLNNELIAICVFSSPVRQNIDLCGHLAKEVKELSRLCVHPRYQRYNFASWFVARCIKTLNDIKMIIAYCDKTFNHNGAVYKACNFKEDRVIAPDYWYVSSDGWIMHKRTLYGHACKMSKTEAEYATERGYEKMWGDEKIRFIYEL